jgi:phosphoglycolate phosphatase-like HAD superfamily hydrolase
MTGAGRARLLFTAIAASLVILGLVATRDTGPAARSAVAAAADPVPVLPSWNDGAARTAILSFVDRVTRAGGPGFVPPPARIAVFDNDGTLWSEQPVYVQLAFAIDRVKVLAPSHPEWAGSQPFKAALEGDLETLAASGERGLLALVMATHAGVTSDEFERIVQDWMATARHPKTGRLYTEMVYQPMLELLAYLRANGFKTFIVSGGGIEFMRPWAERVYGVPPEQVIGSSVKARYEVRNGRPVLARLPEINFIDDKEGKPVGIQQHIGRRPIAAFGNSDGDFQMLEWTTAGPGARLALIVHHDDHARESAYDRESHIGRLARGLDEAAMRGWVVASIARDWKTVFPTTTPE